MTMAMALLYNPNAKKQPRAQNRMTPNSIPETINQP